jgi:hypothetical protein
MATIETAPTILADLAMESVVVFEACCWTGGWQFDALEDHLRAFKKESFAWVLLLLQSSAIIDTCQKLGHSKPVLKTIRCLRG